MWVAQRYRTYILSEKQKNLIKLKIDSTHKNYQRGKKYKYTQNFLIIYAKRLFYTLLCSSQAIFQLYIFPVAASTHVRSAQIENKFAPYSGGDVTIYCSIFSKIRDEKVKHICTYT